MKKKLLWLLLVATTVAYSQSYNYVPLKALGAVPADFTHTYVSKIKDKQDNLGDVSKKSRNEEMSFHRNNEFMIDAYMTSGKVLYGDEVSQYLNEVLDLVLANHKNLRQEIRLYLVRDAEFNAYTTSNGIIFVNTGLLAELETEAQLAFVLAHEVVHYVDNHVRKGYNFKKDLKKSKNARDYNLSQKAKEYYSYSKEQELQADREGFSEYFEKTGYSKLAPYELMDIMLYSYLPYDEIDFNLDVFKTATYGVYSSDYASYVPSEISARDDVADSMHTHPNILARTKAIEDFLDLKEEGKDFLISESRFLAAREQARFETLDDFLTYAKYDRAIYQAFLLLQKYPDDAYLKRAIVYAVYGTAIYKNYSRLPPFVSNLSSVEGALNHVRYILKNIDAEEINTLAVAMSYEYYRDHQDDKLAERIFKDAMWELTHYHEKSLEDFKVMPLILENDSTSLVVEEDDKEVELRTTSKVKRIKKKKEDIVVSGITYAFSSYLNDTLFTNVFEKMEKDVAVYQTNNLPLLVSYSNTTGVQQTLKDMRTRSTPSYGGTFFYPNKKTNVGGYGVKKAMVINPENYIVSAQFREIAHEKSDARTNTYVAALENGAELNNMTLTLFDYKRGASAEEAEAFNEMQALQMYMAEDVNHPNIGIVHYMYHRVAPISEKYDAHHLMATGMVNLEAIGLTQKNKSQLTWYGRILMCFFMPPAAPFVIGSAFVPAYDTYQYMRVLDLETDQTKFSQVIETKMSRSDAYLNNIVFLQLQQLSAKPKYKKSK